MFNYWKKLDEREQVIKALWGVIGLLAFLCCLFFWGWKSAPEQMTVYIPPDITNGITEKAHHIPNEDVYAFAFQMFTAINTWSLAGESDYKSAIHDYRFYMTKPFYDVLQRDYEEREQQGALTRTRLMTGYSGMGYDASKVKVLGPDSWQVDLTLHVVERVGDTIVKDVLIDYPLKVVRVDMSIAQNPWGLAIDSYLGAPERLKTLI